MTSFLTMIAIWVLRVFGLRLFFLPKGLEINPLIAYLKEKVCLCGSNRLAKSCCVPLLPQVIPTTLPSYNAPALKEAIKEVSEHPSLSARAEARAFLKERLQHQVSQTIDEKFLSV